MKQFWENIFHCRFVSAGMEVENPTQARQCTGNEDLRNIKDEFFDMSNLRPEYNVYKAVYALAHALQDMLQCVPGNGPFKDQSCASLQSLEAWQVRVPLQLSLNITLVNF